MLSIMYILRSYTNSAILAKGWRCCFFLTHPEELQCLIAHTPHPFRHLPNLREQPHPACLSADNQRRTIRMGLSS